MLIVSIKSQSVGGASHQPAFIWVAASLLVTRLCPVYLVKELVLVPGVIKGSEGVWDAVNMGSGCG